MKTTWLVYTVYMRFSCGAHLWTCSGTSKNIYRTKEYNEIKFSTEIVFTARTNTDEKTTYTQTAIHCGTNNLCFQNQTGCDFGFHFKMIEDIYQHYYLFWYWKIHRISCSFYGNYSLSFAISISILNKVSHKYDSIWLEGIFFCIYLMNHHDKWYFKTNLFK